MEDSGFARVVPFFRFWLYYKKNRLFTKKFISYKLPFLFPSTPNIYKKNIRIKKTSTSKK